MGARDPVGSKRGRPGPEDPPFNQKVLSMGFRGHEFLRPGLIE